MIKRIILYFVGCFIFVGMGYMFWHLNANNYTIIKEKQHAIVSHPELLPNKELAIISSFGFKNVRADIYWIEVIQYIGSNALQSEYKKYLYPFLDRITDLNPFFLSPYTVGQLLLPNYNARYEDLSEDQQLQLIHEARDIGLKGIENFCDSDKIFLINTQSSLQEIWENPIYANPCKNPDIAFDQGFIYSFYLNDPLLSARYYKISSANKDSLAGAKTMAAVMSGKSGVRERSIVSFTTIAQTKPDITQDQVCYDIAQQLQDLTYSIFQEGYPLSSDLIQELQSTQQTLFPFTTSQDENPLVDNCSWYMQKAFRELNLAYIEAANKVFLQDTGANAPDAKTLFDAGYIDFLPTDFQQYATYGIVYVLNPKTQKFDYEMQAYDEEKN